MNQRVLVAEFMDELAERADKHTNGVLHQAFLHWCVEAEFGQVEWQFTDGASDGGIDAVVWCPEDVPPVVLIQSKFSERVGRSQLSKESYREFNSVVHAFHRRGDDFEDFLGRVREDLKPVYRKAFELLEKLADWRTEKKAFRLVTTHVLRPGAQSDLIPRDNYLDADEVLRLYEQHRKGATPKARPLELTVMDKLCYRDPRRRVTSYLFNACLTDFQKYLQHNDVGRLVARNIRYNLGGSVSRDIRRTYERAPSSFWYFHNGLTIVCDEFMEKDQVATLVNPSVINGAQTLYAITGSARKSSQALVTTRVIVRGPDQTQAAEDDQWLQGVIRGVNTQNRVRAYDFRSNEPEQIELQKKFREVKVFYERKRGEWREFRNEPKYKGFERVSLPQLGEILTVTSDKDGKGVLLVKSGVDHLFEERHYHKLFPSRSKVARRFDRIYLAYRLHRLLERFGYASRKEYREQRQAFWNTLWLLHLGITSVDGLYGVSRLTAIREAFDQFQRTGTWGRWAKKLMKETRRTVWAAWRKARSRDPERWTARNFFKSKYGNKKVLAFALPKVRVRLQSLGRYIAESR